MWQIPLLEFFPADAESPEGGADYVLRYRVNMGLQGDWSEQTWPYPFLMATAPAWRSFLYILTSLVDEEAAEVIQRYIA